jgi:hypothetical protein
MVEDGEKGAKRRKQQNEDLVTEAVLAARNKIFCKGMYEHKVDIFPSGY